MLRVLRPTLSGSPSAFSRSMTTLQSQPSRRTVSAGSDGPCSISQRPAGSGLDACLQGLDQEGAGLGGQAGSHDERAVIVEVVVQASAGLLTGFAGQLFRLMGPTEVPHELL